MNSTFTKKLTMGAAATAFFVLVYAVFAINDSTLQELISLLAIMPLAVYTYIYGAGAGFTAMLACVGLSAFLVQPAIFVTYAVPTAIIGVVQGIVIGRLGTIPAVITVSVLNIMHFIFEIAMTYVFFKINAWAEYKELADTFAKHLPFINAESIMGKLIHDLILCGVPALFVLGAIARAGIYYIVLAVLLNRLFKKNIYFDLPNSVYHLYRSKLLAWLYVAAISALCIMMALTLTGVLSYSVLIAVFVIIVLLYMYAYLLFCMREWGKRASLRSARGLIIVLSAIVLFPITDTIFALRSLTNKSS